MPTIRIKAFPGSKKYHIEETKPEELRVFVREGAERNMANHAIIRTVAEYYKLPPNKLRIITGHRSQNKTIQISD